MVGVVVATHGNLANELLLTAEGVCGKLESCRSVSVRAEASVEASRADIAQAIREVDDGDGVLVLTDMFGGSPANIALTFLDDKVEVVTGVNLPMLVKLATCRAETATVQDVAQTVSGYGQKNITLASELLRSKARASRT